jgi:hypothetical protein
MRRTAEIARKAAVTSVRLRTKHALAAKCNEPGPERDPRDSEPTRTAGARSVRRPWRMSDANSQTERNEVHMKTFDIGRTAIHPARKQEQWLSRDGLRPVPGSSNRPERADSANDATASPQSKNDLDGSPAPARTTLTLRGVERSLADRPSEAAQ